MSNIALERRNGNRIEEPVCTWLKFTTEPAAYATMCIDIGTRGAAFCTGRSIRDGDKVRLNLQLDPSDVELMGEVCWTQRRDDGSCYFGVRFVDPDMQTETAITEHLDSRVTHH